MMAAALPSLVLEAALRGAAVFLAVALAIPLLRRRSAAVRHAAWTFAVGAQLALPALALVAPAWRVPLFHPPAWAAGLVGTHSAPDAAAPRLASPRAPAPAPAAGAGEGGEPAGRGGAHVEPGPGTLAMVWWAGAGLILLQLAVGSIGVWRLAARGSRVLDAEWLARAHELAVRIGISRPLTLLRGDSLAVPVTWGVIYPVLLLPPGAESWDDEQRRYVLVHEMAHIRRFDALTELMGQVTLALFWFNPLVWLAVSRMRAERERACDDYVLRAGTTPSRYAGDLLAMIRALSRPGNRSAGPAFAALAMARRSEFEGRMVAILDDDTDRKPLTGVGLAGGTLAAVVAGLALAGLNPLAANTDASAVRVPVPPAARVAAVDTGPAAAPGPAPAAVQSASPRETATIRKPVKAPPRAQTGEIDRVLASMRQDGDKAAVLANYARSGNDTLLAAAMRAVPSLASDGEKSVVLAHAAAGALRGDPRLRNAFFAAVESIRSDPDRSLVLVHATANARGSPAVAERVLRAAAGMRSAEASTVLMNVAQRRLVTSDPLRALYLEVANAMPSEGDRQRALLALAMAASARAPGNP